MPTPVIYGNPLGFAIGGFDIILPGETKHNTYYCFGPYDKPAIMGSTINEYDGVNLSGITTRVSIYGHFESITVSSASTGGVIAYKIQQ